MALEATPNNLADGPAPYRMAHVLPAAYPRFLVVVREPIDRLSSLYRHLTFICLHRKQPANMSESLRAAPPLSARIFGSSALAYHRALSSTREEEPASSRPDVVSGVDIDGRCAETSERMSAWAATLLHELRRTNQRYGVVSMCIGTGMGAAAVFEAE